jgi:hypothetical protein
MEHEESSVRLDSGLQSYGEQTQSVDQLLIVSLFESHRHEYIACTAGNDYFASFDTMLFGDNHQCCEMSYAG